MLIQDFMMGTGMGLLYFEFEDIGVCTILVSSYFFPNPAVP